MSVLIEDHLPVVKYQGLNTGKNVSTTGNLAVTGTSTFTGVATFTAAPVFTAAPTGQKTVSVLASSGNTTITAASSGSTRLFDSASTTAYTLPAPVVGLYYDFVWTTLETGGQAHSINTDAGTTFIGGYIAMISNVDVTPSATLGPKGFAGAASDSYVKISMNGTTTGGGIGSFLRVVCITSTLWTVTGIVRSPSGTIATPFST